MEIQVHNLLKQYQGNTILDNLSFNIGNKQSIAIVGPSGGGKTTLIRCLVGLESFHKGDVEYIDSQLDESIKIGSIPYGYLFRENIVGFVPQISCLWPYKTILENLTIPLNLRCPNKKLEYENSALNYLDKFGLLGKEHKFPIQLSSGQQQRVSLIRALMLNPKILFLDEVTSALDVENAFLIAKFLNENIVKRRTIIFVTHNMDFAKAIADQIIFIESGKVIENISCSHFFSKENNNRSYHFLKKTRILLDQDRG